MGLPPIHLVLTEHPNGSTTMVESWDTVLHLFRTKNNEPLEEDATPPAERVGSRYHINGHEYICIKAGSLRNCKTHAVLVYYLNLELLTFHRLHSKSPAEA